MSVVDTAKTAYDLAKKGMTVEFQEKIMQLREEALELQEENLRLRKENRELKERIELEETVHFKGKVYWRDGDETPFCPHCFDKSHSLIHIHMMGQSGPSQYYTCPVCHTQYVTQGGTDFRINDPFATI
jgi:regulator of replication initiation timing